MLMVEFWHQITNYRNVACEKYSISLKVSLIIVVGLVRVLLTYISIMSYGMIFEKCKFTMKNMLFWFMAIGNLLSVYLPIALLFLAKYSDYKMISTFLSLSFVFFILSMIYCFIAYIIIKFCFKSFYKFVKSDFMVKYLLVGCYSISLLIFYFILSVPVSKNSQIFVSMSDLTISVSLRECEDGSYYFKIENDEIFRVPEILETGRFVEFIVKNNEIIDYKLFNDNLLTDKKHFINNDNSNEIIKSNTVSYFSL